MLGETLRLRNPAAPPPRATVTYGKSGVALLLMLRSVSQAIVGTGRTMKALLKHVQAFRPQMIKVAA